MSSPEILGDLNDDAGSKKNIVVTGTGRAPWYRADGTALPAFIIGIAGGSASGKTSVASEIIKALDLPWVLVVSQDSFYNSLSPAESKLAFANNFDFDSPNAFDYAALKQCIVDLKASRAVQIPIYSFVQHQRLTETQYLYGAAVVIVEGIFVLHDPEVRKLLDLKVFVQCDPDIMLARRVRRDICERGRDVNGILDQYLKFVKPSFDDHVLPTSKQADVIVPGGNNKVAIDLIVTHIRRQFAERSLCLRTEMSKTPAVLPITSIDPSSISDALQQHHGLGGAVTGLPPVLPQNVVVMKETHQLKGIHTILRDSSTPMEDFIFFSERLATIVVEQALQYLPYTTKEVPVVTGGTYLGKQLDVKHLCGVSILRSGGCFEKGLRRVINDVVLGSMLIQSDDLTGEPLLFHLSLPSCIKSRQEAAKSHVLLLDSQIGTGAAAIMAIRVLLDHGVPQDQITILCFLISARGGVHAISRAFPSVRILTSAIDSGLEERFVIRDSDASEHLAPPRSSQPDLSPSVRAVTLPKWSQVAQDNKARSRANSDAASNPPSTSASRGDSNATGLVGLTDPRGTSSAATTTRSSRSSSVGEVESVESPTAYSSPRRSAVTSSGRSGSVTTPKRNVHVVSAQEARILSASQAQQSQSLIADGLGPPLGMGAGVGSESRGRSGKERESGGSHGTPKKVWAILPGMGSFGDRYYGT